MTSSASLISLIPSIVVIPAAGLLINLLLGKRLRAEAAAQIACLASALTFLVSVLMAVWLAGNPAPVKFTFLEWVQAAGLNLSWVFRVDTLSVTMMLVVSGVGTLIHIYAAGYMRADVVHQGDPSRYNRFFLYLNLFIAAMMILVSADSYMMLFVGWEGVGLCSYLLISFWFEKGRDGIGNARAARKAFVVNRVGDFGLLIAMFMLFRYFGALSFDEVFAKAPEVAASAPFVLTLIALFMLLGVTGKSAQLPLFVWLPDAMAGPTPVSALIHAATMVTAGVYLMVRSLPLFSIAPEAQAAVMWVGTATAFFAATIALAQMDIKKVLAYSTISQLGFMVAAAGMGAPVAAMFHLVTHAFFKALLFLAAGSVILGMEHGAESAYGHHETPRDFDPQDMRGMGGLRRRMPVTFAVYLIGALALAGIPPLAGFFSKDEILLAARLTNPAVYGLLTAAAFGTAFYMGRQILMVFFGSPRSRAAGAAAESRPIITIPLILLAVLSVVGGTLNLPGLHTLEHWLEHSLSGLKPGEFSLVTAGLSLAFSLAGLLIAWLIYGRKAGAQPDQADPLEKSLLVKPLSARWWVDEVYEALVIRPYYWVSGFLARPVDIGLIDGISAGFAWLTQAGASGLRQIQTGYVRSYALLVALGMAAILTYLIWFK